MTLYRILVDEALAAPALIVALDGWVDAAGAATAAAAAIADDGRIAVEFDADALVDYRARRPTLEIEGGVMTAMDWPELSIRRVRAGARDLLVLAGPEPDYRWREFRGALSEIALRLGVVDTVSLGAIPAMVPHTRPTQVLMTGQGRRPLDTDPPLPAEHLQVPAAAVNLVELYLAEHGIPSVGFWAQVPHYVGGPYHGGALALVQRTSAHLGVLLPTDELAELAAGERARLDAIVAERPDVQAMLERLEQTGGAWPVPQVPPGDDLAAEIERFLRESTGDEPG